ncbi:MAG: hypothetical protein ABEJ57_03855 [Halobacteriaceae archaeon]
MGWLRTMLAGEAIQQADQRFYWLWIVATLAYGVGDILTTLTILIADVGIREANLLLRHAFEHLGEWGVVALKLGVFVGALGVSVAGAELWEDPELYYTPPLVLIVIGTVVTTYNLYLLVAL